MNVFLHPWGKMKCFIAVAQFNLTHWCLDDMWSESVELVWVDTATLTACQGQLSCLLTGVELEAHYWQPGHVHDRGKHRREFTCCQGDDYDKCLSVSLSVCLSVCDLFYTILSLSVSSDPVFYLHTPTRLGVYRSSLAGWQPPCKHPWCCEHLHLWSRDTYWQDETCLSHSRPISCTFETNSVCDSV